MRRIALKALPGVLLLCSVAYGQSLGDVARQNRAKEKAKPASAKPKLITNETLPQNPTAGSTETERKLEPVSSKPHSGGQSAEQWKSQILAQKNVVANLQAQIDKVNDSIHFVVANGYSNGVQYNQHQVKKQENVAQMQQQLASMKR